MKFKNYLNKFLHNQEGAEMIEWGIIILIAAGLIVIGFRISDTMGTKMEGVENTLKDSWSEGGETGGGEETAG